MGFEICVEIIEEVRQIEGVHGVHIMACRQEEAVPEIVERAGILRKGAANCGQQEGTGAGLQDQAPGPLSDVWDCPIFTVLATLPGDS